MIQAISKLYIKEGQAQDFIDVFRDMLEPTRKEHGCQQFEIFKDEQDDSILFVLEKWEADNQFSNHINTEHFERIYPKLENLMTQEADINICESVQ